MRYPILILIIAAAFMGSDIKSERPADLIKTRVVNMNDKKLNWKNGILFYADSLFSGLTTNINELRIKHLDYYYKGIKEGWQYSFYPNGSLAEKRYYHKGEKDSIHTGWWINGNRKFQYHFSGGDYNGMFEEWYDDGKLYKQISYLNGHDEWGKGWRNNGKLFLNYISKNGRRYGMMNSNLCYSLVKELPAFYLKSKRGNTSR